MQTALKPLIDAVLFMRPIAAVIFAVTVLVLFWRARDEAGR